MAKKKKTFKVVYIFEISGDSHLVPYVASIFTSYLDGLSRLPDEDERLVVRFAKTSINSKKLKNLLGEITLETYIKPKN